MGKEKTNMNLVPNFYFSLMSTKILQKSQKNFSKKLFLTKNILEIKSVRFFTTKSLTTKNFLKLKKQN